MIRLIEKCKVVVKVVEYLKGKGPVVKTADASLIISSAKPENKKQISGVDLINGNF